MMKKIQWVVPFCVVLLITPFACSKNHGNTANDILDIINTNRTAQKLTKLITSPGLGCIALQYAELCSQNCTNNNTIHCRPTEDDFTEVFAPNCGVELPTFGAISGHILACHHKHLQPQEAFSHAVVEDQKALSLVKNRSFVEAGVGVVKAQHKQGYVWCVMFSESEGNGSFVLDDLGKGIVQKRGCYSGVDMPCNGGPKSSVGWMVLVFYFFFCFVLVMG